MNPTPRPYFGRAFKITVTPASFGGPPRETITLCDSRWSNGDDSLRCTFEIEMATLQWCWQAVVKIYNLNMSTQNTVIEGGDTVNVFAGYEADSLPDALIFQGRIWQPTWEKVDGVDTVLSLRCFFGLFETNSAPLNITFPGGSTHLACVQQVTAMLGIPIEGIDTDALSKKKLPRGKPTFTNVIQFFAQIAEDNHLHFWWGWNGINMRSLIPSIDTAELVFGPPFPNEVTIHPQNAVLYTPTLIGTPQQTQQGITFQVLLDSRIKLAQMVQLDQSTVRQINRQIGTFPASLLDQDGLYIVIGIRYIGDTRGNDWYTEVTAVARTYARGQTNPAGDYLSVAQCMETLRNANALPSQQSRSSLK
jgi:hypothetical protein